MGIPTEIHLKGGVEGEGHRFNYIGKHRYLLTLPTGKARPVFTSAPPTVRVLDALRESCWRFQFEVFAYCFMPDRLLLIVKGKSDDSNLKEFLASFREVTNRKLEGEAVHPLWARKYLERVLRRTEDTGAVARQLFRMPVRAGLVRPGEEYPYKGSFVIVKPSRKPSSARSFRAFPHGSRPR